MTWQDFVTISPLVAGILTAVTILIVDLIRPGKSAVAVGVALVGLAITAVLTIAVGAGTTPSMMTDRLLLTWVRYTSSVDEASSR